MMEIVEPTTGDISLEEAAAIARVSTKTLRRAAASGILPRTYVISERGPRLVFQRDILDRWLASRHRKPRRAAAASPCPAPAADQDPTWQQVRQTVAAFQSTLESSREVIDQLAGQLQRQGASAAQARASLAKLNDMLAAVNQRLENQAAALPAGADRAPTDQPAVRR